MYSQPSESQTQKLELPLLCHLFRPADTKCVTVQPCRHLLVNLGIWIPPPPHEATTPSGPGPPHYRGFTITLRHTTLSRTPLDEWSARRRDLYLTTHNTTDLHLTSHNTTDLYWQHTTLETSTWHHTTLQTSTDNTQHYRPLPDNTQH